MTDHVLIERRGAVQIIRMNRPDKKNALTRAMYAKMSAALIEGDADPAVRVHVFLGVPGAFSSGNDLADFLVIATGGEGGNEVWDFLMALAKTEKPMVSGVDGIAVGIGTTLNLHCDLTFATPRTLFRTPFVDLGLVPEAGSSLLAPQVLGRQGAFALLGLGEGFSAERAKSAGLIYEVVAGDALEGAVLAAADDIAAKPPQALRIARDLMRGPREDLIARIKVESEHFHERLKSDEARAALTAFMTRKKAS
ncbi:crotonase/enoyl-CoA hydratase family protein [Mesorhizobium sp. M1C.F.Ca.ET.193.01.1.1]|uniref:crotonase/enoyl-CoA hydratase family protein n=2 Tax=Mesorhizobium TaxID=68287 RepID=UPI000FD1F4E8|nr:MULTISPECIES: crotonase/enoyl-CoA hydratase family protein [unclassified Mesorhizobium]TGS97227.1 crotonase/enoyl-CoA hydratase family protein [bacterium M00.F.Ca.ET.177.01.1.1]TGQ52386.1 crotonase/enoyl-CoA hydratase family protein [Mesorhizobium sp. M1C.F.Ca.ET.210.01.1.1]TGQ69015.1 crotonase/enoyl-CoA hydratase family protein [Mesorhizobium sp. M1C.F.Ca.ET.212.01.1.1]TGR04569.1 crotonase/enoyl-CoA hydratase family protein [Mesorhizobium sp. M1C.F.Ca.ET.204.01.1.1]TGR25336.1 crotonase/eno